MVRKITFATVSAALCLAQVTPALAQTYTPLASEVQAPLGATGAINLRVPLGPGARTEQPTYGLTFGMGRVVGMDGSRMQTRELRVADIRFNFDGQVQRANVASFDLANLDRDQRFDELAGGSTLLVVLGIAAVGVGVCLLAECFEDDDEEDPV